MVGALGVPRAASYEGSVRVAELPSWRGLSGGPGSVLLQRAGVPPREGSPNPGVGRGVGFFQGILGKVSEARRVPSELGWLAKREGFGAEGDEPPEV